MTCTIYTIYTIYIYIYYIYSQRTDKENTIYLELRVSCYQFSAK